MLVKKVHSIKENLLNKLSQAEDVVMKELHKDNIKFEALFIKMISDESLLQDLIIKPFYEMDNSEQFLDYLQSHPKIKSFKDEQQAIDMFVRGGTILFYHPFIFIFDNQVDLSNFETETLVETTIQGPQTGFTESLPSNLVLIRSRYPKQSLSIESTTVGTVSKTKVAIIHDSEFSDEKVIKRVKEFLLGIDVPVFQSGEQLLNHIKKNNRALFPLLLITERPDRVAVNLANGKVILLVAGSHFAVVLPTVLKDIMASMEDIYQTYWVARFLQILRYFGLVLSIILPGMYVAITSYNPEVVRVQLALSVAGSRAGVPYPSFVEVLFMLTMMELLTEASIRLPKAIGPTATTVGGLILGQAATEAGLVSDIMIIIVSAVAISNFVVPINTFGFSVRILKYIILAFATFFGLIGVVICSFLIIANFVKQDSFGQPFLTLIQSKPRIK